MIRLAVVEDNPDNLLLMIALLEDRFEIVPFEDGQSAVLGIAACAPALVLLDVSLPGMSGIDVLAHLRLDPSTTDLPVIAVTAHAMAGDRRRLLEQGFDGYISKPIVDENALMNAIDLHLSGC